VGEERCTTVGNSPEPDRVVAKKEVRLEPVGDEENDPK
jgi:hypothetical protein